MTSLGVLTRLNAQTLQTLTHFKLIIGVKAVFADLVQIYVSSIVDLANPPLPVVRQVCLDITQENIWLRQEEDAVLKHLKHGKETIQNRFGLQ